jgi:hypothetical protein
VPQSSSHDTGDLITTYCSTSQSQYNIKAPFEGVIPTVQFWGYQGRSERFPLPEPIALAVCILCAAACTLVVFLRPTVETSFFEPDLRSIHVRSLACNCSLPNGWTQLQVLEDLCSPRTVSHSSLCLLHWGLLYHLGHLLGHLFPGPQCSIH